MAKSAIDGIPKRTRLLTGAGLLLAILIIILFMVLTAQRTPQLAFSSNGDIFTVQADGMKLTNLTHGAGQNTLPSWSPQGARLAFCSNRNGPSELFIMNADGSNPHRLTDAVKKCALAGGAGPVWSHDGQWLGALSINGGYNQLILASLYTLRADGSQAFNVSNHPATDLGLSWSPDDRRILFTSEQDGNTDIYRVNYDGYDLTRLTHNPANDRAAVWAPYGTRIAFSSDRDGNWEIYVMNADGSSQTNLTRSPGQDMAPHWLPDGKQIAFTSDRDGNWEIYVMKTDGSEPVNLTHSPENETIAWWSPNGKLVALIGWTGTIEDPNPRWDSWIMNADGTGRKLFEPFAAAINDFSWRP